MIKGIFIIILFLFLGEAAAWLIDGVIPGNVLGMVGLFLSLVVGLVKADEVRPVALWLTRNMALFFVPASIGVMAAWPLISANWGAMTIIAVGTTLLVVAVVGLLQERACRKQKAKLEADAQSDEAVIKADAQVNEAIIKADARAVSFNPNSRSKKK